MATRARLETFRAPDAAKRMAEAASRFLDSLSREQRAQAIFPFGGDERHTWHYTPVSRNGLRLEEMEARQREAAFALMASGLSERGNRTAREIIHLETILGEWEEMQGSGGRWLRDPERYWFSVFGEPGSNEPWGWRVGGHHVCLHYAVVRNELVSPNPLFFGANPAEVRHGEHKGKRTLPEEEDMARTLLRGLPTDQRGRAVVDATAPADILTKNYRVAERDAAPAGLPLGEMNGDGREVLARLIRHYVERSSNDLSANQWGKIEAEGLEPVTFAWAGPEEPGHGHYYAVKGPPS